MSETSPGIAALSYPNRGLRIMACHWPTPSELPQFCSCGDIDCPTPARHPIGTLTIDQATANLGQLARWWQANPAANVATMSDERVGVIELHHPARPGTLMQALKAHHAAQAPMIYADQGVVHLLVKPDPYLDQSAADIASHPTSSTDKVVITPPGTLVLLPPSRSMTRLRIHWMSHLHHVDRLPEAAHMLEVLTELRKDGVLDELDPRLFSSSPA
jgi:Bifunctional DNA primase/polymerase, N-terminal